MGPAARLRLCDARPPRATPVSVHHLVLERQGSLRVAGIEVESCFPGEGLGARVEPRMLSLFLQLAGRPVSAGPQCRA